MILRTDLAVEERDNFSGEIEGVDYKENKIDDMTITEIKIKSKLASKRMNKQQGTYITIDVPPFTDDYTDITERTKFISNEILKLLPKEGLILVAGIGNKEITPDNFGPKTISHILATRHIKGELAKSVGLDKLRPVAAISAGVLGQTGIETGEILCSLVSKLKPDALIAIDALASRKLDRLGCTVQISDTGIAPGSGVGNHRLEINQKTVGTPVISIGVPTVVDALTLANDILGNSKEIKDIVSPRGESMMVTPREIDLLIERSSKLVGMSINCALQPNYEFEVLSSLVS